MGSDIVERLRECGVITPVKMTLLREEAAAEIERLRAENELYVPRFADGTIVTDHHDVTVFQVFGGKVYENVGDLEWTPRHGWCVVWGGPDHDAPLLSKCYSTREAAERAGGVQRGE